MLTGRAHGAELSDENKRAAARAMQAGIRLVLATGKSWPAVRQFAEQIGSEVLEASESEYMAARAEDVRDVSMRMARCSWAGLHLLFGLWNDLLSWSRASFHRRTLPSSTPTSSAPSSSRRGAGRAIRRVARSLGIPARRGRRTDGRGRGRSRDCGRWRFGHTRPRMSSMRS